MNLFSTDSMMAFTRFMGVRTAVEKLVKSPIAWEWKDPESRKHFPAAWDWKLIEAFYEHIWQEVTSVATAVWKKTGWVGLGSVMNGALNSLPEFSKESPITTIEGIIGWGAVKFVFCTAKYSHIFVQALQADEMGVHFVLFCISQAQHSLWEGWELTSPRNSRIYLSLDLANSVNRKCHRCPQIILYFSLELIYTLGFIFKSVCNYRLSIFPIYF